MAAADLNTLGDASEKHSAGDSTIELAGPGSLACTQCGFAISLAAFEELPRTERLPTCPTCGGTEFRRLSIFNRPTFDDDAMAAPGAAPSWLADARVQATDEPHLAWYDLDGEEPEVVRLPEGWTRIGRGMGADVRLDDPSVSRRHALVVRTETGELRALDDRSLNGLFVNGDKVDWTKLSDGDELEIGSYRLYVIDPS